MNRGRIKRISLASLLLVGMVCGAVAGDDPPGPVLSGCEYDYPPFCTVTKEKVAGGFSVELLRAALAAMGRDVTFKVGLWAELKEDLAGGRLHALPLVARTPERESVFEFTAPYLVIHGVVVVREGDGRIRGFEDLEGMRVAVLKGDAIEEYVRRVGLQADVRATTTFVEALREVEAGTCDAVLIPQLLFFHLVKQQGLKGLVCLSPPIKGYEQRCSFAVREGDKDLLAALNEGLAVVHANGTFRQLYDKWFAPLTPVRISRSRIVVGGSRHLPPYEFLDRNGKPAGLNVDVTRAIAARIGVPVDIRLDAWAAVMEQLRSGDIDIIQSMAYSADRDEGIDFSLPHHRAEGVIVTRADEPEGRMLRDFTNRVVLVRHGDLLEKLAVEAGLGNRLVPVDTAAEALARLAGGQGDCVLVDRISALSMIREHGWKNLRVGSESILSKRHCFAVKAGNDELLSQFGEGLAALEESGELRRIREKWLASYEKPKVTVGQVAVIVLWVVGPLLVLLAAALVWSRMLKREVVRKTAELQESETRFRSFMDNSPAIAWAKDEEGRHVYLNRTFENRFGAHWMGKTDAQLWPPDTAKTFRENDAAVREGNRPIEVQEETVNPDGSRCVWMNFKFPFMGADGRRYVGGIGVEVTERRRAEEALRQSEEKFRSIVNASPMGMHLYRLEPDGGLVLTGGNPAADRMLGVRHETLLGKRIEDAFPNLVSTDIPGLYKRVAAGEIGPQVFEIPYSDERFSGVYDVRVFRISTSTIAVNFLDISDRKRLEEALRQSEKMQAIGQLAGGVAHDFNNQLGGIMGFAELLAESLEDSTLKGYASRILGAATRATDLTQQLLAFGRKGKYRSVPVDVHAVIGDVVGLLNRSIDKRIEVRQHLDANPSTVIADPTQIQNAILNLGLNARDAMPEGGTLTFSTQVMSFAEEIPHEELAPGRYVQISVTDTGVGMSEATKRRLFEPFFTTKEVGKGTGLGLASSYGAVKNHGGTIRVVSEVGRGSTFSVYLPLHEVDAGGAPVSAADGAAQPASKGRVMMVDDEPVILDLGSTMLRKHGYEVVTCRDSREALEAYRKEWRGIDLVILDMVMPKMGGRDLFLALREINPGIKALLSSGYTLDGEAQAILDLGVLGFVQKPFRMADLTGRVREVLRGRS